MARKKNEKRNAAKTRGPAEAWFAKGTPWFFVSPKPVKKPRPEHELKGGVNVYAAQ